MTGIIIKPQLREPKKTASPKTTTLLDLLLPRTLAHETYLSFLTPKLPLSRLSQKSPRVTPPSSSSSSSAPFHATPVPATGHDINAPLIPGIDRPSAVGVAVPPTTHSMTATPPPPASVSAGMAPDHLSRKRNKPKIENDTKIPQASRSRRGLAPKGGKGI